MKEEKQIKKAIKGSMGKINAVDNEIIMEVVGVAHAVSDLRKALDKLDHLLDQRKFRDAADLGYRDIASRFIFLQRTLSGLDSAVYSKESLVSDIAVQSDVGVYEKVAPFVDQVMDSAKILTEKEKARNKKKGKKLIKKFKSKLNVQNQDK